MEITGPPSKTISRIEPGGFRSPQFIFSPTKDCVEGKIQASVTYIDYQDNPHTIHVEPYIIRSVCDLLKPLETTMEEFDLMLFDMETTSDERTMQWNPQVLFSKAETFLPARNFHVLDKKSDIQGGIFRGMIRGLAEGKYTGKKVALRISISGPADGHESKVKIEGLGDDIAMLPTTIEEIEDGIDSWICLNCGGALSTEEVTKLNSRIPVECRYCGHTLTINLYRK
jgi:DNA-directed RNA polymerase subunit RPC12/RpoP